jgi:hypothetical protein
MAPGTNRAGSPGGSEKDEDALLKLVCVGAELGVVREIPQEPQNWFPSGTSLAHDGQVDTISP